ncbi:S8 family peptidase [Intrasporangium calvum]|uniref:Peptidase S8 and S53 subtilisin kexin sedolisin n=1 Tax=Intrasporangium calvum (strain ATCC 23552 / DSM 43043 / JCM 3097 / NBRC 12989 / NCIMB 10167 / NRRL B-3866 / 7 KIP) TaxID=710696 RepID=E6S7D4_INTC7|nr:S8 family serine peptidase [Intrasporangium calvum]ADU50097.1 peptidase S8 and S53 subtilisin kexin sedolisin [Intrasporangium calvum DSM 43043]
MSNQPTTPPWWQGGVPNGRQRGRLRVQLDRIVDGLQSAPQNVARNVVIEEARTGEDVDYLYRGGAVLVRDGDVDRVLEIIRETAGDGAAVEEPVGGPPQRGVATIALPAGADTNAVLAALHAQGVDASKDLVLHICPSASACPATEPVLAQAGPVPAVADWSPQATDRKVSVAVIDTDYHRSVVQQHSWLRKVTGDAGGPKAHGHYRGHGTFVGGVVATMAPEADVRVWPALLTSGGQLASDLGPILDAVLETRPDIISLSAGTTLAPGEDPARELLSLRVFREHLAKTDTLLVCAAGNDAQDERFYPAGLPHPEIVGVGALDPDDRTPAGYSNFGNWVDVWARGTDVVNGYPNGRYEYADIDPDTPGDQPGSVEFTNWLASWSGTSFATPLVAGLVAARMAWSHEKPRDAWAALHQIAVANAVDGRPVLKRGDSDRPPV